MTPNLRAPRDSDARKIIDNAHETLVRIRAFHAHYSSLRIAIEARMVDGLGAADYDGEVRGSSDTTPVERAAMVRERDKAHDDLVSLQHAIRQLEDADNAIAGLISKYPLWGAGPAKGQKPGEGTCPVGLCVTCWEYGTSEQVADGRYKRYCLWDGEWKAAHGQKALRPIWEIHRQGKRVTTADIRKHAPHLLLGTSAAS